MSEKEDLLNDLDEKFVQIQQGLGFKSSFEEVEDAFFIKDAILSVGFVSENFSRQLCSRIIETFSNWVNYLHTLIIPNPQSMINLHESKIFSQDEKNEIGKIMNKAMAFASKSNLIGLTKNKKEEAKFIDDAVQFWNSEFKPGLMEIMEKISGGWK